MNTSTIRLTRRTVVAAGLLAAALLGGCSRKVSGTYVAGDGKLTITFTDGKAHATVDRGMDMGTADYTETDDKITLGKKLNDKVLTKNSDGTLTLGDVVLTKK